MAAEVVSVGTMPDVHCLSNPFVEIEYVEKMSPVHMRTSMQNEWKLLALMRAH